MQSNSSLQNRWPRSYYMCFELQMVVVGKNNDFYRVFVKSILTTKCILYFSLSNLIFFGNHNSLLDNVLVLYSNVTYNSTKQSKHQPVVSIQIKQPVWFCIMCINSSLVKLDRLKGSVDRWQPLWLKLFLFWKLQNLCLLALFVCKE